MTQLSSSRRTFLASMSAAATGLALHSAWAPQRLAKAADSDRPLELGLDNFAVRAAGWKAESLIDYAAKQSVDALFITDLDAFASLADDALIKVREQAAERNVRLYVGTWSICPTSKTFRDKWGTAEEHLELGIRVAKMVGSPVLRVVLGSREDRKTPGGIRARIADTVKVLQAKRGTAIDAGVKIAVENHAGDMHSLELVDLVEAAGKDFVGVNLDSGNAVWTLEDPQLNLQNLGPYVLTSSLRDTVAWESEQGVTAQWTAMGAGSVDWDRYFATFRQLCPLAPVNIETISGFNHEMPTKNEQFWQEWSGGVKPQGYDAFLAFVKLGEPRPPHPGFPEENRRAQEEQYQKTELEASLEYCKKKGLGQIGRGTSRS